MRWDHWVLPPAVSAAVFAVLAVSPPVRLPPASPMRLESLGDPAPGRPWLLRALVAAGSDRPPPSRLSSPDGPVATLAHLASMGSWFSVHVPPAATTVRLRFSDVAGTHPLRAAVHPITTALPSPPPADSVHVLEGTLLPELASEVIVAPHATAVAIVPITEEVTVSPARSDVDECGLASFELRVTGLGAPVSLVASTAAGERRASLRLPLAAGGIAVRDEGDAVLVRATTAGATAHLVAGDAVGPTWWSAATLSAVDDEGRARVALPAGVLWVVAARGGDLSDPVSPLVRPAGPPCLATPAGRRLARGRLPPSTLPPRRVLWDGPAEGAARAQGLIQRARVLCCIGLATSVVLEGMLLVGAGLSLGPVALRSLAIDRRQRLGVLAAGLSTLLLLGAAMGLAVGLRTP